MPPPASTASEGLAPMVGAEALCRSWPNGPMCTTHGRRSAQGCRSQGAWTRPCGYTVPLRRLDVRFGDDHRPQGHRAEVMLLRRVRPARDTAAGQPVTPRVERGGGGHAVPQRPSLRGASHGCAPRLIWRPSTGAQRGRIVGRVAKTLRCRIGCHSWRRAQTDDGQGFQGCASCGSLKNPGGISGGITPAG